MKMFKAMYFLASIMWVMFSVAAIGLLRQQLSLENFISFSILFIAILLEEIYYLIEERIIDARKV